MHYAQSRQSARIFLCSLPNWGPTQLLTRRRVCPPLFGSGGNILAGGRGSGGVPIRTRGQTLWYSRYIRFVLCDQYNWSIQKLEVFEINRYRKIDQLKLSTTFAYYHVTEQRKWASRIIVGLGGGGVANS